MLQPSLNPDRLANMIDRNIFTAAKSSTEKALEVLLAVLIGLALAVGALAWFDVLFV